MKDCGQGFASDERQPLKKRQERPAAGKQVGIL